VQDSAQTGSVTGELLSAAPLKGNVERHGISAPLGDGLATEAALEIGLLGRAGHERKVVAV